MDSRVCTWRDEKKHLPPFMRDFHDCKDLFKSIDQYLTSDDDHPGRISWVKAHCYTIDFFLWFMAQHGYTLQKSRARLPFDDLGDLLKTLKAERSSHASAALSAMIKREAPDD